MPYTTTQPAIEVPNRGGDGGRVERRCLPLSRERRARRGNRGWAGGDGAASVVAQSGGGSGARRGRRAGPWRNRRGDGRAKAARKGEEVWRREKGVVRCEETDTARGESCFLGLVPEPPGSFRIDPCSFPSAFGCAERVDRQFSFLFFSTSQVVFHNKVSILKAVIG